MRSLINLLATLIVLVTLVAYLCCFVVDEREQAVVLQFGKPISSLTEPGLYFKVPILQTVRYFPKTILSWGGIQEDELPDLTTGDARKVELTPWALWRITSPVDFVKLIRDIPTAEQRVQQYTRNALRDTISQNKLIEVIRSSNRPLTYTFGADFLDKSDKSGTGIAIEQPEELAASVKIGRPKVLEGVRQEAFSRLTEEKDTARGIEILDIGIARIDFADSVRQAAFQRLIKFMEAIAAYYTSDGERRKQEILNRTQARVQKIRGEGKKQASEIRGAVDAEIIRQYAEAIRETGDFYFFQRKLQAFKKALGKDTRLILTTDNEFLKLLQELTPAEEPTHPAPAELPAPETP